MRRLFLSLLYFSVSCTYSCTEMPSGMLQVDQNALAEAGSLEVNDVSVKINELLAEALRQLFSEGHVNFEGFKQKTYELMSDPEYLALMERASLMEGGECGSCGGSESDSCGEGVDTSHRDVGGSCAASN